MIAYLMDTLPEVMTINNWCIIIIGKYRDITLYRILLNASRIILRCTVSSDAGF